MTRSVLTYEGDEVLDAGVRSAVLRRPSSITSRRRSSSAVAIIFALASGCAPRASVGVASIAREPFELAEGVVSTGHEYGTTFSLDGTRVLFSRSDSVSRRVHIFESRLSAGHWGPATLLPMSSAMWSDLDPSISPDGRRLYFVSTRPHPGSTPGVPDMDIWFAEANGAGWGTPQWIPSLSSGAKEGSPTTDRMGQLCFFSDRDAPSGTNAIYCADPASAGFGVPVRLGASVNAGPSDTSPFLAPDGLTLLFYSTRVGGAGSADLYAVFRQGSEWGPATNLGRAVNTEAPEYNPVVARDGATLVFGRNRRLYQIAIDALGVGGLSALRFR